MDQKRSTFILDIPPKGQFLILMSLYLIFSSFSFSIISNFSNSSGNIKLGMCFNSVVSFFIPAFILLKLVKRSKLADYWNFNIISIRSFLITIVIMICCFVIMNWLGQINKQLPMFNWMKENDSNESLKWQQYLKMSTLFQFIVNLFVFSFVPAFCEEVFFRGTMQPIWTKYLKRNWLAIITTAFIFSFLHFQFSGFLPRFLAGIVIGGIYYYTASLWLCFLCHAFYNGTLVVLNYAAQHNLIKETTVENIILNPVLLLCTVPAILFLFYQLRKNFPGEGLSLSTFSK